MSFQKFHGIALAANSWIQNLVIEPVTVDPTPVGPARAWYNSTDKALKFSSLDGGGAVIVQTVATGADVQAVVDALTALGARVAGIEGDYIKKDGSVAFTGNVDLGSNKIVNVAAGESGTDAVNYAQLQSAIGSLANAFKYIGTVSGGVDAGTAFDLTNVSDQSVGAYYKVAAAGYFKVGTEGDAFFANLNDGLVFNVASGVDIVDNTNSTVAGTANFISVTGSPDTGYTVDIDGAFKLRVTTLESGLAAEIARAQGVEGDLSTLTTAVKTSLTAAINSEVSRATGAEAGLQSNIDAEASARGAADTALGNKIGDLTTLTTTDKSSAVAAINSEVSRATAAEGALSTSIGTVATNLASEVSRATAAEQAVDAKVGDLGDLETTDKSSVVNAINELANGGSAADGKIGDLTTLTTDAKDTLVNAINEVDAHADAAKTAADTANAAVAAETSRAQGVEGSLASLTTTAKGNLVAAVNEVNAGLAAEVARATGVEGTLTSGLAAEIARAEAAEGDLTELTTTAKDSLVDAINEVAAAAGEGTGALKDAINAQRFRFTAVSAALSHVITHNLNSAFVQVQIWVKDTTSGLFYNDMVAMEETNSNTITITLTEAKIVKVVVQALDDLA